MRLCLIGLAALALAQPATATEHHRSRHHHTHHHHSHRPQLAPDLDSASLPFVSEPVRLRSTRGETHDSAYDAMIARHAAANGVPVDLVRHVVMRESRYNPRATSAGNYGLMQIRHATARGLGYSGSAAGLLDPETNLTYAVRYLAGAYRLAGGNSTRAYAYYRSGYYRRGDSARVVQVRGDEADLPVKRVVVKEIHLGRPDDAASAPVAKAIVVREVAVKDASIKDQSRVVNTPLVRATVEREPPALRAATAEGAAPLRAAAEREPRIRVRYGHHRRHAREAADSGVLDSILKIAARGSIKPKQRAPLARAD